MSAIQNLLDELAADYNSKLMKENEINARMLAEALGIDMGAAKRILDGREELEKRDGAYDPKTGRTCTAYRKKS